MYSCWVALHLMMLLQAARVNLNKFLLMSPPYLMLLEPFEVTCSQWPEISGNKLLLVACYYCGEVIFLSIAITSSWHSRIYSLSHFHRLRSGFQICLYSCSTHCILCLRSWFLFSWGDPGKLWNGSFCATFVLVLLVLLQIFNSELVLLCNSKMLFWSRWPHGSHSRVEEWTPQKVVMLKISCANVL